MIASKTEGFFCEINSQMTSWKQTFLLNRNQEERQGSLLYSCSQDPLFIPHPCYVVECLHLARCATSCLSSLASENHADPASQPCHAVQCY